MMLINGDVADGISPLDRGVAYGDGLFETVTVVNGKPVLWDYHTDRLLAGCQRLGIHFTDRKILEAELQSLLDKSDKQIVKIIITRGAGPRGYKTDDSIPPTRIIIRTDFPSSRSGFSHTGIRVRLCDTRLAVQPLLAGLKHLNRLEQILARNEWDDDNIQEGLMLDNDGRVIECISSNVFFVDDNTLITPTIDHCGVEGVQRRHIINTARRLKLPLSIRAIMLEEAMGFDEMFVTNSLIGVWPVKELMGKKLFIGSTTRKLQSLLYSP